ncbi:hypothetical protein EKD04_004835 [Chloroflexales bacterium ZM16-3]|nr:hypothetical protein [Chloroflexales bacterium ZM16-3]
MHSSIQSTSQPTTQGSTIGYLCMLVMLAFVIGLLALGTPASTNPPSPMFLTAPTSAPLTGPNMLLDRNQGQ